ncbi:hypothetical protein, partial [Pseudonocardia sp. 73-21]|uniref:hypothetical protein n=1 Tax=Pseudonocardia sp. 73-21 TaxID=1895809 RepID=UPI0026232C0E
MPGQQFPSDERYDVAELPRTRSGCPACGPHHPHRVAQLRAENHVGKARLPVAGGGGGGRGAPARGASLLVARQPGPAQ